MDTKTFLENFGVIADAPNGVQQLRKLIYDLAVEGKLISLNSSTSELNATEMDQRRRIKNVVKMFNGNSTSAGEKARLAKNQLGVPYIATKDIEYGFQPVDYQTGLYVDKEDAKYKIAPKGAVLICLEGGSAGRKMALLDRDVAFGNKLFANVCNEELDPKFLLITFLSTSFQNQFKAGMSGIIGGISKARFSEIEISVPSIERQEKIVAKVDDLMALCDELEAEKAKQEALRSAARDSAIDAISTATTPEELSTAWSRISNNWEVVSDSIKSVDRLRSLIVLLGVSGRLADCSESSADVSRLIKSMAESKATALSDLRRADKDFIQNESPRILDFPQHWAQGYLGEFCLVVMGNSPPGDSYRDSEGDGVPLINGPVEFSANPLGNTLKTKFTTSPTYMCKQNDMLVCVRGATTGRTNIAGFDACIGRGVALVRAWESQSFVNLIMWNVGAQLLAAGKGTTFPSISYKDIAGLHVGIPPLEEQERIVAKVSELLSYCDQIEAHLRLRSEIESLFAGASSQLLTV